MDEPMNSGPQSNLPGDPSITSPIDSLMTQGSPQTPIQPSQVETPVPVVESHSNTAKIVVLLAIVVLGTGSALYFLLPRESIEPPTQVTCEELKKGALESGTEIDPRSPCSH